MLTDGAWRDTLLDVPRHHFVPTYIYAPDRTTWRHQRRPDPDNVATHAWLAHVYDRVPLIVALSDVNLWGRQHPVAVSPDPALTMHLLHTLDVRATNRVLELGTGSGHTTALLAHRVGADHVTSVEIDTELHHLAAHRLDQLDLHPHLVHADAPPSTPRSTPPLHTPTQLPTVTCHRQDLPGRAAAGSTASWLATPSITSPPHGCATPTRARCSWPPSPAGSASDTRSYCAAARPRRTETRRPGAQV